MGLTHISIQVQYPSLHLVHPLLTGLGCAFISVTGRQPQDEELQYITKDGKIINVYQREYGSRISPRDEMALTFTVENPEEVVQAIDEDLGKFLIADGAITQWEENGFALKLCFMPCVVRLVQIPQPQRPAYHPTEDKERMKIGKRRRREGGIVERDNDLL